MPIRGGRFWLVRRLGLSRARLITLWATCGACTANRQSNLSEIVCGIRDTRAGGSVRRPAEPPAMQGGDRTSGKGSAVRIVSADIMANPGRCHATQNITLTMLLQGDEITGYLHLRVR